MTNRQEQGARSASLCTEQQAVNFPPTPRMCAIRRPGVQNLLCNCTYNEYLL